VQPYFFGKSQYSGIAGVSPAVAPQREVPRKPNAENPPVQFEEEGHSRNCAVAACTLTG
jgi:hypothetical protein